MLKGYGQRDGSARGIMRVGIAALLVGSGWVGTAASQTLIPQPAPPCMPQPQLPIVPLKAPRTPEGPHPNEQWQMGDGNAPTASFIDALRGNDAAFKVVVGQGRLMTIKPELASPQGKGVVAVGDPTVVEFEVLPNPHMIRVIGRRVGVTDLSITAADGQTYSFEVQVVYDLDVLRAQMRQHFPDALLKLAQLREHLIVEGEARSPEQLSQILKTLESYLESVQVPHETESQQQPGVGAQGRPTRATTPPRVPAPPAPSNGTGPGANANGAGNEATAAPLPPAFAYPEPQGDVRVKATYAKPRIINLLRVPGVHQVLLQVRVAELNRTAIREIGADILGVDPHTGNIMGTRIGGAGAPALSTPGGTVSALGLLGLGGMASSGAMGNAPAATVFGIFPSGDFEIMIRALRSNSLLSILAEPNLMAMNGHRASFLAGGQFPVPVAQVSGGVANSITVEWKDFGVQLDFVPYVLEDETIRMLVTPEVSSIDFALGTVLVPGGSITPGLNTRRATTTVELRQGQTLAIAGLLQVELSGSTNRVPGLGDLPYLGPLFSNTSHKRVEKELLVLVTPFLVSPMNPCQVPPLPGADLQDPNDCEFYLLNRIEGRTGQDFRSTTAWDDPLGLVRLMKLERRCVSGPVGFSD